MRRLRHERSLGSLSKPPGPVSADYEGKPYKGLSPMIFTAPGGVDRLRSGGGSPIGAQGQRPRVDRIPRRARQGPGKPFSGRFIGFRGGEPDAFVSILLNARTERRNALLGRAERRKQRLRFADFGHFRRR
jgi:hypothetical protein